MKKLITILLLFIFCKSIAADYLITPFPKQPYKIIGGVKVYNPFSTNAGVTYYVSTSGNNANAGTSIGTAWRTNIYAMAHASSGDIISVQAGTYLENGKINVPVGVSWEGVDSSTCIIQDTVTTIWTEMVALESSQGTNGNQHISGLKFEGQNTTQWGLKIYGRSNVSINNCSFSNFVENGVIIDGGNNTGFATILATGNSFYNSVMNNCSGYTLPTGTYARGCLNIGSQEGFQMYGNTITQNSRAVGYNGEPVKYWNGGLMVNCKFHDNTLTKMALTAANGTYDWDFCMEMFELYQCEFYNNTLINGGFDLVNSRKGFFGYTYGVWVHNNTIGNPTPNSFRQVGVTLEYGTRDAIVEYNTFNNIATGLYFTPRDTGNYVTNIKIRNNLMTLTVGNNNGTFVDFGGGSTQHYDSIDVVNNTCLFLPTYGAFLGISLPVATGGYIKRIKIFNNILTGSTYAVIYQEPGSTVVMDSLNIKYNDIYGNTGSDSIWNGNFHGTNFGWANNININPSYTGNYIPTNSTVLTGASDGGAIGWTGGTNVPPVANAGADTVLIQPTSSLTIVGSATDADGTIASKAWTQVSGPATITFTNGTTYIPTLSGLTTAGTYVVRLTVTDNLGATGTSDRTITVRAAPTVNGVINKAFPRRIIVGH